MADSLYQQQQYFESAVFCERVLFEQGNESEVVQQAILLKMQCYKKQQAFAKAAGFGMSMQGRIHNDSVRQNLHADIATCYYLAGDFEKVIAETDKTQVLFQQNTHAGWMSLLKILSLNELRRWNEAALLYKQQSMVYSDSLPDYYAKLPRQKSEKRAYWLATFIPGGGHLYAGKPWEALASIVLQGAGVYYGINSWINDYYINAWLIGGGLTGTFHMGGMARAQELVRIYNRRKANEFNQKVKDALLARW
ncbi:hypothetical protein [Filimonas lacunae]|uniref:hypothetical protein n=1 Tax=Filimonas lacunae TaxID=477680 RepID=UPI0007D713E8|nr:hypothetical protein [Filimonas lacunae]BAV04262.1 hypothetical protein FLA_0243 [Filimonas lacunae]